MCQTKGVGLMHVHSNSAPAKIKNMPIKYHLPVTADQVAIPELDQKKKEKNNLRVTHKVLFSPIVIL